MRVFRQQLVDRLGRCCSSPEIFTHELADLGITGSERRAVICASAEPDADGAASPGGGQGFGR